MKTEIPTERLSRKAAVVQAFGIEPESIYRANGKDRYFEYRVKGTPQRIVVVTREWQLPVGDWHKIDHVGRYIIYSNSKQK